jgi:hypothetical protein
MITPSYSLTATERVLPRLALDFTTASLDPRVTFTRSGNTATVTNSSGVIVAVNADIPRFDFDPVTLACRGLLIEESRANALLNSLIDGTSLATQSVTVTAAARTLSFYGTGEIVLSGAASATVTGTGAYPTRTTLTFTPSAGTLTLTVTGTVQFAQLELGSFATSFIPTAAAAVTRNADVATMTGTNFSDWFNATEGAINVAFTMQGSDSTTRKTFEIGDGGTTNLIDSYVSSLAGNARVRVSGSNQCLFGGSASASQKLTLAYKADNFAAAFSGAATQTDTAGTIPSGMTQLRLGSNAASGNVLCGWLESFEYYPQRLTNNEVRATSK